MSRWTSRQNAPRMSRWTSRKVKGVLIIAMMIVAEGRSIEQKTLSADAANRQPPRANGSDASEAKNNAANVLRPAIAAHFDLDGLFNDPGFVKQVQAMAGHMDKSAGLMKTKPSVWARADEMNTELDRLMDNPSSYMNSMLPEQMEAMFADPEFKKHAHMFADEMHRNAEFQKEVAGLTAALSTQQTAMHVAETNLAEKFDVVRSDPKFQQRQERITSVLDSLMQDSEFQKQANAIADYVESLKDPTKHSNEAEIRQVTEQIDAMMTNAKLGGMASEVVSEMLRNELKSTSMEWIAYLNPDELASISEDPEVWESIIEETHKSQEASPRSLLEVFEPAGPFAPLSPPSAFAPFDRAVLKPLLGTNHAQFLRPAQRRPGTITAAGRNMHQLIPQRRVGKSAVMAARKEDEGLDLSSSPPHTNKLPGDGRPAADADLWITDRTDDSWKRPWSGPKYYRTPSSRLRARLSEDEEERGPGCTVDDIQENRDCVDVSEDSSEDSSEYSSEDGSERYVNDDPEGPGCSVDDAVKNRDCDDVPEDGSAVTSAKGLRSMMPALVEALPKGAVTSADRKQWKKNFSLFFCLAIWYTGNYFYNVANKIALERSGGAAGFPMTIATLQLGIGSVYALFMWLAPDARKVPDISFKDYVSTMPLSFAAAGAQAASVLALGAGSVSFVQIVKASEPAFAAVIAVLIYGTAVSTAKWLTLIPVIAGVVLASLGEVNFALAALVSASVGNIFAAFKAGENNRLMRRKGLSKRIGGVGNQFAITTVNSFLLLLPMMFFAEGQRFGEFVAMMQTDSILQYNLIASGLWSYIYNGFATRVVKKTGPVTRSVASTAGRVIFILACAIFMKEVLTPLKLIGSGMAIGGVYIYSIIDNLVAARKEKQRKRGEAVADTKGPTLTIV